MSHIEWTADLEVGIGVIDGQHRRIVDYINALQDLEGHPDREVVGRVIDDLVDYTYSHFAFEEALMEEAGYEFLAIHQNTHRAFRERVDELKHRFAADEEVAVPLANLLKTWLIDHIQNDDSSYAPLVKQMLPRIEHKAQGAWLGSTLRRFFAP